MRLHVHRSGETFLEALKTGSGCHYATFDRSSVSPLVLRAVEALARERGHENVTAIPALRAPAEGLMREYFDATARQDPQSCFAFSSRVLLAIPDYPDVALLFLLRALSAAAPGGTAHALVEDPWKAELVRYEAEGGARPAFRPGGFRGFARAARSAARRLFCRPRAARCDVVIVTLGENVASGGADAYFGDLAATLATKCRVVTVYSAPGTRIRLPSSETIAPLEAYLKPLDPLRAWAASRAARGEGNAAPEEALTAYLRARELDAGEVAMLQVMSRAFDGMIAGLKPRAVVYPFENRTWEKSLLRAARKHGVRCVGYQHSSITPRHLALSSAAGLAGMADLPDAIIACGEVTAGIIASAIPQARPLITAGPALRARRLQVPPPPGSGTGPLGVLAPISSSRAEAWEILRVMHELTRECDAPIVVRTHPTIPIDDLYAQFEWPAQVMLSRGRGLAEDLAAASMVAYSSSTVALEGMLYGRLPVYLDIGDVPSGNPIAGAHRFLSHARTGRELAQAIERVRGHSAAELAALREAARSYAEQYLVAPTHANVERMAEHIAAC